MPIMSGDRFRANSELRQRLFEGHKIPMTPWDRWKERWTPNWLRWLFPINYRIVPPTTGIKYSDIILYQDSPRKYEHKTYNLGFTYAQEILYPDNQPQNSKEQIDSRPNS